MDDLDDMCAIELFKHVSQRNGWTEGQMLWALEDFLRTLPDQDKVRSSLKEWLLNVEGNYRASE